MKEMKKICSFEYLHNFGLLRKSPNLKYLAVETIVKIEEQPNVKNSMRTELIRFDSRCDLIQIISEPINFVRTLFLTFG